MLPESFTRRVMAELGPEEGRALCEALEGPAPTSVRLHPQRPCRWSGAEAVPWSPAGRYLTERPSFTLDPAFHAGAYYVQEASSQFLAHVLAGEEVAGKRILDLCAAPGGKTTLYASLAGSDGLVVANEVNRQRAAVLADNVRKWGLGNTLSESGSVARGVCETNAEKHLTSVVERTQIERRDGKVMFKEGDTWTAIDDNAPVSMNMWGFTPDYFKYSEEYFVKFLKENADNIKAEYFIPLLVNDLIQTGKASVTVLDTPSKWFGVTYAAARQSVVDKIHALIAAGEYPEKLF